ncbi:uncharacterized protein LOC135375882 [Ornithodoros turicata]|uniref:uncharacterized protein LOC135375882 n=1 Tax=Ornithodoros turicata TaxID=34597 RepID=UPI00313A23ED
MSPSSLIVVLILGGFCVAAKRNPKIAGYKDIDLKSPELKKILQFVVKAKLKQENKPGVVVRFTRAEKQVVAGANYRLTFQARICDKGKPCVLNDKKNFSSHCVAVVNDVPWLHSRTLTSLDCQDPR